MPAASHHIDRALHLIGAASQVKPASPAMIQEALALYNELVARWVNNGLEIGAIPVENPGDESYSHEWAGPAIQYNLAVELAPVAQVEPSKVVMARAERLYDEVRERVRLNKIAPDRVEYPGRLPVGSGNSCPRWGRTFYPKPEE